MPKRDLDEWFWQVGTEFQRFSEEILKTSRPLAGKRCWEPRVDVVEDENGFLIKAELAGVRGEDVQLYYVADRHSLYIRGVRRESDGLEATRIGCYQLEIYYGEFEREVRLPELTVNPKGIKAQFRNGILFVTVPKAEDGFESLRSEECPK
jgi:HSP20 family protein